MLGCLWMTNRASTRCRFSFLSIIFLYIRSLCIYYIDRLDGAIDIARTRCIPLQCTMQRYYDTRVLLYTLLLINRSLMICSSGCSKSGRKSMTSCIRIKKHNVSLKRHRITNFHLSRLSSENVTSSLSAMRTVPVPCFFFPSLPTYTSAGQKEH